MPFWTDIAGDRMAKRMHLHAALTMQRVLWKSLRPVQEMVWKQGTRLLSPPW